MKIKIYHGQVAPGDVNDYHLVTNHLKDPTQNIDKLIMYAEKRYLMTMIVSGTMDSKIAMAGYTPKGKDTVATIIKPIPQGDMISDNAFTYRIMPRMLRSMEFISTSGTPTTGTQIEGGFFSIICRGEQNVPVITHQMNVQFRNDKIARVMVVPTRVGDNLFLYRFQCYPGDTYSEATWIGTQSGQRTIYGGHTTVGERSRRGYGYFTYPDKYIQHTTKQRKSFSISGDADVQNVVWYELDGQKGFSYEAERQLRTQLLLEDEDQKWNGRSTMRDQYGNLLTTPSMVDENNQPIVAGDGLIAQIEGSNDSISSGIGGKPTYDDFVDMVRRLKKKRDYEGTYPFFAVTGSLGIQWAEEIIGAQAATMGFQYSINPTQEIGGMELTVGFKFRRLNVAGEQLIFVENPAWDDGERYPHKSSYGYDLKSGSYLFLDNRPLDSGKSNMEILTRGRAGINRNLVYMWENGMTGGTAKPDSPIDANTFHLFKENSMVCYDTSTFGRLLMDVNA